jgi:hypothetical protein
MAVSWSSAVKESLMKTGLLSLMSTTSTVTVALLFSFSCSTTNTI